MKIIISFLIAFSCSIALFGQGYYYYYDGQKQQLELDTEHIRVYAIGERTIPKVIADKKIKYSSPTVYRHAMTDIIKKKQRTSEDVFWAEIKLEENLNTKSYNEIINNLKSGDNIITISPSFKKNNNKIGLSNSFYVKLKYEKDTLILQKYAKENSVSIIKQNQFMPLWFTLSCSSATKGNALDMANKFYESRQFVASEPELMVDWQLTSSDPYFSDQWGLKNTGQYGGIRGVDINVENAWLITKGKGVKVAVIDHGIQLDHPDLKNNIHTISFDSYSNTIGSIVRGEHGTACAGIIGAVENNIGITGVAPQSTLLSISSHLDLNYTTPNQLADGFNWAWKNGADVISNSWGSNDLMSNILTDAINNAVNNGRNGKGCIVVFASGNNNGNIMYPATLPNVITVGAISPCGERKSPKSCDGEQWGSNYGDNLSVVAPGVLISTTDLTGIYGYNPNINIHKKSGGSKVTNDYSNRDYTIWFNGTSAACPYVAGVAALILSESPQLTQNEVRAIIESSARKELPTNYQFNINKTNGYWNNEIGYGLVDAGAALLKSNSTSYNISGDYNIWQDKSNMRYTLNGLKGNIDYSKLQWRIVSGDGGLITLTPFRSPQGGYTNTVVLSIPSHEGGVRLKGSIVLEAFHPDLNIRATTELTAIPRYIDGYFKPVSGAQRTFFDLQSGYPMNLNLTYSLYPEQINRAIDFYITNPDPYRQGNRGALKITPIDTYWGGFWFNGTNMGTVSLSDRRNTVSFRIDYSGEMGTLSKIVTLKAAYPKSLSVSLYSDYIGVALDGDLSFNTGISVLRSKMPSSLSTERFRYEIVPLISVSRIVTGSLNLNENQAQQIDISRLMNGIYVLTIYNSDNEKVYSNKFQVKR